MRNHWFDRISEYVDGELSPAEARAFEAQIEIDPELSNAVNDIRMLTTEASNLGIIEPPEEVWTAIRSQIESKPEVEHRRAPAPSPNYPRSRIRIWQVVAAALAVVMVSGAMGWILRDIGVPGRPQIKYVQVPVSEAGSTKLAVYAEEEERLSDSIAELESLLRSQGQYLDEETRSIVEDNLIRIGSSIREAREALASDPSSEFLHDHLASSMQRKVRLLENATRLASSEI